MLLQLLLQAADMIYFGKYRFTYGAGDGLLSDLQVLAHLFYERSLRHHRYESGRHEESHRVYIKPSYRPYRSYIDEHTGHDQPHDIAEHVRRIRQRIGYEEFIPWNNIGYYGHS